MIEWYADQMACVCRVQVSHVDQSGINGMTRLLQAFGVRVETTLINS